MNSEQQTNDTTFVHDPNKEALYLEIMDCLAKYNAGTVDLKEVKKYDMEDIHKARAYSYRLMSRKYNGEKVASKTP